VLSLSLRLVPELVSDQKMHLAISVRLRILYLEQARFVTGETLHIDGGQTAGH
jgi:hypothetical protein